MVAPAIPVNALLGMPAFARVGRAREIASPAPRPAA